MLLATTTIRTYRPFRLDHLAGSAFNCENAITPRAAPKIVEQLVMFCEGIDAEADVPF